MDEAAAPASEQDTAHSESALIPGRNGGTLRPWVPGQSGNPAGRPKDEERILAMMLRQHPDAFERAASRLAEVMDDPNSRHWLGAVKEAWDRREGTLQQSTHHHVSTDRAIVTHAPIAHAPALPGSEPVADAHAQLDARASGVPVLPSDAPTSDAARPCVPARVEGVGVGASSSSTDALGTPSGGAGGTGGVPDAATPHALGTPSPGPEQAGADS